jgi:hypothetical protein
MQVKNNKIIISIGLWNEMKNNPYYSELIEDIEDRIELEEAIKEHKMSGQKMINIDDYLKKRKKHPDAKAKV